MKKYDNYCKALNNLRIGLQVKEPYSIVEQTGIVGLFEICFEQSWKLMKQVLEEHGRLIDSIGSPKAVIKIAYQCGMIDDEETWLNLLEARNILAHTYSDEQALAIINKLKNGLFTAFEDLKKELDERWLDYLN